MEKDGQRREDDEEWKKNKKGRWKRVKGGENNAVLAVGRGWFLASTTMSLTIRR
jgi:hypothetical protein